MYWQAKINSQHWYQDDAAAQARERAEYSGEEAEHHQQEGNACSHSASPRANRILSRTWSSDASTRKTMATAPSTTIMEIIIINGIDSPPSKAPRITAMIGV